MGLSPRTMASAPRRVATTEAITAQVAVAAIKKPPWKVREAVSGTNIHSAAVAAAPAMPATETTLRALRERGGPHKAKASASAAPTSRLCARVSLP